MKKLRVIACFLLSLIICLVVFPVSNAVHAEERVYIGGFPIGISIDVGGLLVENITGVETEYGTAYVDGIERGDIIIEINGHNVQSIDDIQRYIDENKTVLKIIRGGNTMELTVRPIKEMYSAKARLGIKIKEKIYGIGTMTFVRENGNYTALGHEIFDSDSGVHISDCAGKLHACKIIGIKRGGRGEAGAILASLVPGADIGTVTVNNSFGIAGRYDAKLIGAQSIVLGDRSEVKPGAARIRTTIDDTPEYYDIEIIKASRQNGRKEKGLVFRVTDQKLLAISGGVLRGMSGSPIIQNGKLIGAVTHVFLNDFTKGYGVYADCLN